MMKTRWWVIVVVLAAVLGPHDGRAEATKADARGETVFVGDRFFHTVVGTLGADGALEVRCGAEDQN